MRSPEHEAWVQRARSSSVEDELKRRGHHQTLKPVGVELVGPCPKCGGDDRFGINPAKGVWNCRQCKSETDTGDVIGLVQWWDNCSFNEACTTLTGEPPPKEKKDDKKKKGNAKPYSPTVARYVYKQADGTPYLQVCRTEAKTFFQNKWNG